MQFDLPYVMRARRKDAHTTQYDSAKENALRQPDKQAGLGKGYFCGGGGIKREHAGDLRVSHAYQADIGKRARLFGQA